MSGEPQQVTAAFKIITADLMLKGIWWTAVLRCDVIAEGVVQAAKDIACVWWCDWAQNPEGKAILEQVDVDCR